MVSGGYVYVRRTSGRRGEMIVFVSWCWCYSGGRLKEEWSLLEGGLV